ncbi:MAG: N-6 DNA methylase, partial [Candidatus Delongbacteria bacterium]|nr:N-6 DNA methylase [Candidatus Delongbacteria bacterium]
GVKNLFRYSEKFSISKNEVKALFKDIPFLNGGLFDCLDKPDDDGKIIYVDGFSRNAKKQSHIPDNVFFSDEIEIDLNEIYGTRSKRYKVQGLINLLDSYKFTVAENTPVEEEIALDPELLGKVFENLLASYNPETKTTARKQTGSFYTPREIVNYMVDESLIEYLKQTCKSDAENFEENLKNLFSYSEDINPFDEKESKSIIKALNQCRILDPACGSGAFPMGILHKMVHMLTKLDPENSYWKQLQKERAIEETNIAYDIEDHDERRRRLDEIEEVFENNISDYGRKLYLIENCIYGIDIQPIAVQIAKLRFFISLIIDQNKIDDRENYGIRSLPNLETKFVAANTLISLDKPQLTTGDIFLNDTYQEINKLSSQLKEIRHKYFNAKIRDEKLKFQKEDKKLRKEISNLLVKVGHTTINAHKIAAFDPYDQNHFANWFEPEWMFGKDVMKGFDIVIGNPPYVVDRNLTNQEKKYFEMNYHSALYQINLYLLFIEKALILLADKGSVSFIVPNTWLINKTVGGFRKYFVENFIIKSISDLTKVEVFDATVLPIIFFAINQRIKAPYQISVNDYFENIFKFKLSINSSDILTDKDNLINYQLAPEKLNILRKIQNETMQLKDVAMVSFGVKFYQVNKGVPKQTKSIVENHSFTHTRKVSKHCKRILEGRDIDRYTITAGNKWIEYGEWLAEPRKPELFEGERILLRRIVGKGYLVSTIVEGDYCNNSLLHTVKVNHEKIKPKYLLGILNSKLMGFYFITRFARDEKTFPEIRVHELESLPIKFIRNQDIIVSIVDKILLEKNKNPKADVQHLEYKLNQLVYNIYGLSEEETQIIEDNFL